MKRILAVALIVLGLIGLGLGRLGETSWAPDSENTATVQLKDPGSAVVIDPGVLYVGGTEGKATIQASGEVTLVTAPKSDIEAYLGKAKYTRLTGLSSWESITAEPVNPKGEKEIPNPKTSDLWRDVKTSASPASIDIAAFHREEAKDKPQPYRAIMIVTDGKAAGASTVSLTWPREASNAWVPFAYAIGATLAVIGLILLVLTLGSGSRREDEDELAEEDLADDEQMEDQPVVNESVENEPVVYAPVVNEDQPLDRRDDEAADAPELGAEHTADSEIDAASGLEPAVPLAARLREDEATDSDLAAADSLEDEGHLRDDAPPSADATEPVPTDPTEPVPTHPTQPLLSDRTEQLEPITDDDVMPPSEEQRETNTRTGAPRHRRAIDPLENNTEEQR